MLESSVTDTPVTETPLDGDPTAESADGATADAAGAVDEDAEGGAGPSEALLVREGDIAGDYLERLLDIVDYDGDIDLDVEGDRAVVAVIGGELQGLIGASGVTLEALQELTRLAVQQQTGVRSRLMLDIGGYRARRRTALADIARSAASDVLSTSQAVRLDAMNPFERKVVHDTISVIDGVRSESEGEEPERRVVVMPDR
ncbi:MAG: spoIIIJ-associated protein [Mycobacteriales bacterium]|jgi:spoIIIJ-associated protein